jgi:very-short-patch-repair endonuclease
MRTQSTTVEHELARIAGRAHGVVARAELLAVGVTPSGIRRRVAKGTLIVEYPGVYRVGHRAPSTEARYMAAVKACGEGAVLSGRAAACLLSLIPGPPPPPEVTTRSKRRVRGVITHRARRIEAMRHRGIPVTTVPRTLVDIAAQTDAERLARACHEAGVRYGTTPKQVEASLKPNTSGAGKLRLVMRGDVKVTLSTLERRFLSLLREHGLPLPRTNRRTGSYRVDCRWPEHKLTVELDSYRYHRSRYAWEQDYRREREARARGDEPRRYTWSDVFEDPAYMLAELGALLATR